MTLSTLIRSMIDPDGSPLASHDLRALAMAWDAPRSAIDAYSMAYARYLDTGKDRPDPEALDAARLRP